VFDLHEIPPAGQRLAALITLGILRHLPLAATPVDSANSLHLQIEGMKLALDDVHRYCVDPDFTDVKALDLLADDYLASRATLVDMAATGSPEFGVPRPGGTFYPTAADESGMIVSLI
jgi:gamma-glutamyltranspeptidase/glutathione hydrolase